MPVKQHVTTIQDLIETFPTSIEGFEFLALLDGIKPCNRIVLFPDKEAHTLAFLRKYDLHCVASDFRVKIEDSAPFQNKGSIITDSDEPGAAIWYISADRALAEQTKRAEADKDHITLGANLGYPECCTRFFLENVPTRPDQDFTIPVVEAADDTRYPFVNNVLRRDDFLTIIFHFPCSFGCHASEDIGWRIFELMKRFNAKAADSIRLELCKTVAAGNKQIHFGK